MKTMLVTAVLTLALAAASHAEERALSGFERVSASAGTQVEITAGAGFGVEVSGRDADRVTTRVSGGTLIIEPVRGWSWRGRRDALVRVSMPRISGLGASSGARIQANSINGGNIDLDASSGAHLDVNGVCAAFQADASSGANIDAQELRCENGSVHVSSGAHTQVFASDRLDVDASSGGAVRAFGNPGIGNIDLSSGGTLRRVN